MNTEVDFGLGMLHILSIPLVDHFISLFTFQASQKLQGVLIDSSDYHIYGQSITSQASCAATSSTIRYTMIAFWKVGDLSA
jgi:hypothetical protein